MENTQATAHEKLWTDEQFMQKVNELKKEGVKSSKAYEIAARHFGYNTYAELRVKRVLGKDKAWKGYAKHQKPRAK